MGWGPSRLDTQIRRRDRWKEMERGLALAGADYAVADADSLGVGEVLAGEFTYAGV